MKSIGRNSGVLVLLGSLAWAVVAACGSDSKGSAFGNGADAAGDTGPGPSFGDPGDTGPSTFADFGTAAIIDTGDGGAGSATTPANAADLFTAATAAGGDAGDGSSPCLAEPEVDSLVPRNWLRPRFSWAGSGGANLFEIRVHASNQTNDLVVYTNASQWIMPAATWTSFASHSAGADITISIRGGTLTNGTLTNVTQGSHGAWSIAPVDAPGSIVYWYIAGSVGELKGFSVGDEDTRVVLTPQQAGTNQCIGCHTSTPDGNFAVFSTDDNNWKTGIGSIKSDSVGQKPSYITSAATAAMTNTLKGQTATSAGWWTMGKHYIAAVREDLNKLAFVNLDETDANKVLTTLTATGLPSNTKPSAPAWSHDGTHIAFANGDETTGRTNGGDNDVYVLPFNETGASVTATALAGAATTANEYYPAYSPGDKLVAFTKTQQGESSYAAEHAEVMVVSAAGGTAQRLAANDPPACSGKVSPGVENSWPKWAPAGTSQTIGDKTYYWLVFSSTRNAPARSGAKRQLFMAPVVVDAAGNVAQYKAVYLWNQPADESNHTPAWDVFAIPPSTGGGVK